MSKPLIIGIIITVIVVTCLGAIAIEAQTTILHRAYDNFVLDNKHHYLPCEKLHQEAEVRQIVQEHQDMIQAIEGVNPGFVGIEIDTSCPGKADLVIWYASHENRMKIEKIINNDTFFGVPYTLNNR